MPKIQGRPKHHVCVGQERSAHDASSRRQFPGRSKSATIPCPSGHIHLSSGRCPVLCRKGRFTICILLQIHYAKPLPDPDHTGLSLQYQRSETKYQAGILLMLRGSLSIPPNTVSNLFETKSPHVAHIQPATHGDVNCVLPSNTPLHMFGYRTHAHALGSVITGYVYNEKDHK